MTNLPDDAYYIERVLSGDLSCYTYLVDRYSKRVYTFIVRIIRNREDAEEVCQDVFVKAYNSLSSFKKESSFSTWIYRIAYNTTISATRKRRKEYLVIDEKQLINVTEDEILLTLERNSKEEQLTLLHETLSKLPPEESALIILFYIKEKGVKDVAQITGLSESNVKTKLHRIRKKMHLVLINKRVKL